MTARVNSRQPCDFFPTVPLPACQTSETRGKTRGPNQTRGFPGFSQGSRGEYATGIHKHCNCRKLTFGVTQKEGTTQVPNSIHLLRCTFQDAS